MKQLNSLIIEGNLTRDSEYKEPSAGFKVCILPIAVNRRYKDSSDNWVEDTSYFDVETYGKFAEICQKEAKKGRGVRIVGRLKQARWEDKDGAKHSKVLIIAEHIEFKKQEHKDLTPEELSNIAIANQESINQGLHDADPANEESEAIF